MAKKIPENILVQALRLQPQQAIEFLKNKGFEVTWGWKEQLLINNSEVFTVAKAMKMDILQDIRDGISKALTDGITFDQFKEELEPLLRAKGWWGQRLVETAGGIEKVQLGSPYRLRTIFQTNTQSAYMAGRWDSQKENEEDRPFLEYVAIMDGRTRERHAEQNGKIFPIGDPYWEIWYPPNGYNCRCRTRALTREQAGERKKDNNKRGRKKPDEGFSQNPGTKEFKPDMSRYDKAVREEAERLQP